MIKQNTVTITQLLAKRHFKWTNILLRKREFHTWHHSVN